MKYEIYMRNMTYILFLVSTWNLYWNDYCYTFYIEMMLKYTYIESIKSHQQYIFNIETITTILFILNNIEIYLCRICGISPTIHFQYRYATKKNFHTKLTVVHTVLIQLTRIPYCHHTIPVQLQYKFYTGIHIKRNYTVYI